MEFRFVKCGILFAVSWVFVTSFLLAWFFIVPCYVNGPLIQYETASAQSSFKSPESESTERPGLRGSKETGWCHVVFLFPSLKIMFSDDHEFYLLLF